MFELDGLLLYDNRLVTPRALRERVLDVLHAAQQGVSSMTHRASDSVYWPGISADIANRRAMCPTCKKHSPSLQQVPSPQSDPPTAPFKCIAADYCDLNGSHYLVCADRLSGWIDIYGAPSAGAKGLVACLRSLFCAKGVPVEQSSDGGPEFTSGETRAFLERLGVRHRLSLAYHPQSNG